MSSQGALRDGHGPGFELIETLRWEREAGYVRLARHMARLEDSAAALGFGFDRGAAATVLDAAPEQGSPAQMLRVRLTLGAAARAAAFSEPFAPALPGTVWRLRIARIRLDSADQLLRHKTSRRAIYDAARAEYARDDADEVLLLNERGDVCEGTITTLFLDQGDGGPLLTPPLRCGLLAGVLRQELLDAGRAVERTLLPADLAEAAAVYVGNSLRGLIEARVQL